MRLDHFEVYLDYAKHKLELFKETNEEEDFNTALNCLNKIVEKSEFNQFNVFDISEAHYLLGKIYLFGNAFHKRDAKVGIEHIESSRLDKAYLALLEFYKEFGNKYIKSIRKCIGMISDQSLRLSLMQENGFPLPASVDISNVLKKLHFSPAIGNIEPVLSVETLPSDSEENSYEESLKKEELLRESKNIAEDFDPSALSDLIEDDVNMEIHLDDDYMLGENQDDEAPDFIMEQEFEYPELDEPEDPDIEDPDM